MGGDESSHEETVLVSGNVTCSEKDPQRRFGVLVRVRLNA